MPKDYICNLRLVDQHGEVLGWTKIPCETRGDGGIWAKQHFVFEADQDGVGTEVCIHEPDLHVWTYQPLPAPIRVSAGKVFTIRLDQALLQFGTSDRPLPSVTVRTSQVIGMGAVAHS